MSSQRRTIGILACTQIISWGSLHYAFSILAPIIQDDLGWSTSLVFGAYSWGLLVAGLVAAPFGILLDRHGGQLVMGIGSVVCGIGFIVLSRSHGSLAYIVAWTILGIAMGLILYEAAFATINRKFTRDGRKAISTLTLFAGFSSTVFWPLTQASSSEFGWRNTYFWFGVAQFLVCLPLHIMLGRERPMQLSSTPTQGRSHTLAEAIRHPAFWKLTIAFAANTFVFSALSVHLIPLLHDLGHSARVAVLMSMLIGPMQVLGRILERTIWRNTTPQTIGIFCFTSLPAALLAICLFGTQSWAIACFCVLYGLSNGIITIVRGTLPQTMFGSAHYGAISGAMAGPSLLAKAGGPMIAALVLSHAGLPSTLLGLLLCVALVSVLSFLSATRTAAMLKASTPI